MVLKFLTISEKKKVGGGLIFSFCTGLCKWGSRSYSARWKWLACTISFNLRKALSSSVWFYRWGNWGMGWQCPLPEGTRKEWWSQVWTWAFECWAHVLSDSDIGWLPKWTQEQVVQLAGEQGTWGGWAGDRARRLKQIRSLRSLNDYGPSPSGTKKARRSDVTIRVVF